LPAVLVEPRKRTLAGERRDVEEQQAVVGQESPSALCEFGDQAEPLVGVVVALSRARDVRRIANDHVAAAGDAEAGVIGCGQTSETDVRWEISASVSEAQRIAVRLMSEANARSMPSTLAG